MASLIPMALYGLEVPAGDVAMSARPEVPSAFRITMAAIDPSAEPEGEEGAIPRATLKIIRQPLDIDDFDDSEDEYDSDDFDAEEMERILAEEDSEDDEDDEETAAGPSDPKKSKAARKAAAEAEIRKLLEEDGMDVDDKKVNGLSAKAKGKQPASDDDSEDDEEELYDSDDSDLEGEIEEFVICTLDPSKNWQQPLDITIGEDERVWFKVSGTHSIYLTGNYVADANDESNLYDPEDDEDEDYDLEPDSDELDEDDLDSEEEDELDGLADPRVTEIDDEEVPELVKADKKSKSKKRAAEEEETLDSLIKADDEKLSKKQQKKLKKNDGSAAAVEESGSAKKVQFAKNLEQGPTPTKEKAGEKKAETKATTGVKVVQGVTIDDKKVGSGPAAKKGDRVGMRYIGKLKDGKVFDSNKKGKPFTFKLGAGEVIKGWEIGIAGLTVGGERRITVPAHLAYGSKALPGIPANSTLIFDVKLIDLNKGK